MRQITALTLIFMSLLAVFFVFEPFQLHNRALAQEATDLAACKFYRNAENPPAKEYQSALLLSYIAKASQITGVPTNVLAGLVRIESTVGPPYSATGKSYSISDYNDSDVQAMSDSSKIKDNIDATIDGNKALCPRSVTGALGITQIQPNASAHQTVINRVPAGNTVPPAYSTVGAHPEDGVNKGIAFLQQAGLMDSDDKSAADLDVEDYCNPQKSLILSAGVILSKLASQGGNGNRYGDGTKWDPGWSNSEEVISQVAVRYYGNDGQTGSYANSLWRSVESCKNPTFSGTGIQKVASTNGTITTQTIVSNTFVTKVGNPAGPAPGGNTTAPGGPPTSGSPLGFTLTCPLAPEGNYKINCGTAANPTGNCGHGHPSLYQACKAPPYASCPNGGHSEALKHSIDVVLKSTGDAGGAPVFFPYINGNQVVEWKSVAGPIAIDGGAWGYKHEYTASVDGKLLKLDLTHVDSLAQVSGKSGEQVTSVYQGTDGPGRGHLHTLLYVDGTPVEPKDVGLCSGV